MPNSFRQETLIDSFSRSGFHTEEVAVASTLILSLFHQTLSNMKLQNQKRSSHVMQSASGEENANDNDNVSRYF